MTVQIFGLNILRCLSEPFGQYGDILCAPQSDPELWLKKSKAQIKASNRFHGIRLRHVREDSRAFAYLQQNFQRVGSMDAAPFLDLKQYQDEIAYAQRYTKIQRRRRQKIHKDLEKIGPLTFKVLTQGAPLSSAVSHAIEAKRHWLVKHGRYSAAVFSATLTQILNTVAHTADSNVRVVATVLQAGDEEISFEIGLRYKDRHYAYLTAHQPALTDASPGRLHMDYSQRNALNSGFAFFDLLIPLDPHKTSWSSGRISASDYWLPLTLRGSLYGKAYLVVLRPLLRQLVHLSPEILRKAAGLLLRQLHRRSR